MPDIIARIIFDVIRRYRKAVRMGQHVWLLLATILTELLVIKKWSKGLFLQPFPAAVKWGWGIGGSLLVLYPIVQVRFSRILIFTFLLCLESDDSLSPSLVSLP